MGKVEHGEGEIYTFQPQSQCVNISSRCLALTKEKKSAFAALWGDRRCQL
jgi:hypothetical protein